MSTQLNNQKGENKNPNKILNNPSLSKEQKYNYLEHSFERSLQRSYDRRQLSSERKRMSPPSIQSPLYNNPTLKFSYNSPKDKSQPFHLGPLERSSQQRSSEFSPYENREDNVRERLAMHQIKNQNRLLNEKLVDYERMLDQLHIQLKLKNEELSTLGQMLQKEKITMQQITNQMKQEISVLLSKNTMLEKKIMVLERQLKEVERSKSIIQSRSRSVSANVQATNKINSTIVTQIKQLLFSQAKKNMKTRQRDSGKVLNLNHSFNNSRNVSPQNQKTDRNASFSKPDQNADPIVLDLREKMMRLHKFEELINSVLEMYHKIMGSRISESAAHCRSSDMKVIWKWLKTLGHNFNIVNKWKKVLAESLQTSSPYCGHNRSCEQEPIEQIFQKIVFILHEKKY